jgi:hypothetical protein
VIVGVKLTQRGNISSKGIAEGTDGAGNGSNWSSSLSLLNFGDWLSSWGSENTGAQRESCKYGCGVELHIDI